MDRINSAELSKSLYAHFRFFAGVPDSVLNEMCAALQNKLPENAFYTTANEGNAVALCVGYTLATGKPGVAYMQNSGLGNAVNPLLSLNDALIYSIPTLLLIGWRGEPGVIDEPQHKKQGLITRELLDICNIPYKVLEHVESDVAWAYGQLCKTSAPVALLVRKDSFTGFSYSCSNDYCLSREKAIDAILDAVDGMDCLIVSTTGMISRELYSLRKSRGNGHDRDFLTVGSMGHASSIALGLAIQYPEKKIICLDGDGAALMHMGALAVIGTSGVDNYVHVVLNNAAHDSVGGQPTCAGNINLKQIASACGYTHCHTALDEDETRFLLMKAMANRGRHFVEIKVALRGHADLMRPPHDMTAQKQRFIKAAQL